MYKYINYLPPELKTIKELQAIGDGIDPIAKQTYDYTVQQYLNQFIMTSDTPAVERWEDIFRISPFSDDTLETRRLRIISKFIQKLPFTWRVLHDYISVFSNDFSVNRDFENQHLDVKAFLKENLKITELVSSLRILIPADMTLLLTARERSQGMVYVGATAYTGTKIRVLPYQPDDIKETVPISLGGYSWSGQLIRILPKEA